MPILIFTMHFVIAIVYFTCFTWFRLRSQCIDKRSPSKIILFTLTFSQFSQKQLLYSAHLEAQGLTLLSRHCFCPPYILGGKFLFEVFINKTPS